MNFIMKICSSRYWVFYTLAITFLLSLTTSFPDREIYNNKESFSHQVVYQKASHPFTQVDYSPETHESKLTFRLTIPLLIRLLRLNILSIFIMEYLIGILLFYLTLKLSYDIFQNSFYAFLITIATGQVFSGTTALVESVAMFDGAAIALLLSAMYFKAPILKTALVFLAGFCDERAIIASPLIIIYDMNDNVDLKGFFGGLCASTPLSVIAAWILYATCRISLMNIYGLKTATGDVGFHLILNQIHYLPISLWTALEGLWILVIFSISILFHKRKYMFLMMFLSSLAAIILVALAVLDVTRSLAYMLPGIFVSMKVLKGNVDYDLKKILLGILFISLLCPNFYVCGNDCFIWSPSIFVRLLCNSY